MRLLTAIVSTACIALLGIMTGYAQIPLTAQQERALKPMDSFKECDKCPEMVVVPAGSFMMGSPENEAGRLDAMGWSDDGPLHQVTFAQPFAVGRFAITFDEWEACVAERGCKPPEALGGWGTLETVLLDFVNAQKERLEGRWHGARQPAIFISWDDAAAYVKWLSSKTGKTYRLLSEASANT